jgi:hypothetical protein
VQRRGDRLEAGRHELRLGGDEHDLRAGVARAAGGVEGRRPASWEIATTRPPLGGASEVSNASRAASVAPGAASPTMARAARAACSLVPQPVKSTGWSASIAAWIRDARRTAASLPAIRAGSSGSAQIISSVIQGGPARSSGL